MRRILVICVHNSARSQMFEAYLRHFGDPDWEVESAGFEPRPINPLVVQVMAEEGFDLSAKGSQSAFALFRAGRVFDTVVTVCGDGEDRCPIYPGMTHRLHLPFPDPSTVTGTPEEQLAQVRAIRDAIKTAAQELAAWLRSGAALGSQWTLTRHRPQNA